MASIISNQQLIDAPPTNGLRYGLFNAVQGPLPLDSRGIGAGIQFFTDHCDGVNLYETSCDTPNPEKIFIEGSDLMAAQPFWVYSAKKCGLVGRTPGEMEEAARKQLIAGEQTAVETSVWSAGGATNAPNLANSGATVVTPAAPGAGAAIAALEEAAYSALGYRGVIHINMSAYGALAYANLFVQDGNVFRTPIGSKWALGAGYETTGPNDDPAAAGFVWAFITSQVTMWRSDIISAPTPQVVDRVNNQYTMVAERVYIVTWDCPEVFAVQVPIAAPAVATTPAVP